MSEVAAPAAPAVAPTNGAHPTTPQKPAAAVKAPPMDAKPVEIDDSEEYVVDGKPVRLSKAQRQLHFQKALAADKRLKEAADTRNKAEELLKLFETDPEAALAKAGKDPAKVFGEHMAKKAKLELMSPEQREAEKLQRERDEYKAKVEATESERAEARKAEADKLNFGAVEKQILAAADKHGLDSDPDTLDSICAIALEFLDLGIVISADQAAEEHIQREKEHISKRDQKVLSKLEGKKLLSHLGPDIVAKVKAAMAQADADSLNEIPKPQAKPKIQVKAHEREVKGYVRETDFDKKFLK